SHKRCRFATDKCAEEQPTLDTVTATHQVSCHLWEAIQQEASTI
ncbi:MAG TPA: peptide ABC transporter substrate-binding protein, partial [Lysinibacillus sp.]|nr:peptide ABC transporter substrate-binding protein [Lysinibacillus sp.]